MIIANLKGNLQIHVSARFVAVVVTPTHKQEVVHGHDPRGVSSCKVGNSVVCTANLLTRHHRHLINIGAHS